MGLITLRDLVQFPAGDNDTDTFINGRHYNLTALELYDYRLFENHTGQFTISNESRCYLIFDKYQPFLYPNGSWVNGTSCYFPYYEIGTRGAAGVAFAALFTASIMFTLINLRKHGKLYLREDRRFRVVGRRWQWYWMLFVAACAMISTLTGVDVDRNYLQGLPIVLQSFFFSLMIPGTLAMVWEATRHWGSWQERQICDRDIYGLPQDDRRSKTEFYLPLIFYLFAWLNFFMVIPRAWDPLQKQRSLLQQETIAGPSATDVRMKAGSIMAAIAWFVICFSLRHSIHHYKPKNRGMWNSFNGFCHYCPTKLFLAIVLLALRIAYAIASAWEFDISLLKYDSNPAWPYTLGYGSTILIMIVLEVAGFIDENEDKILIAQRAERGRAADAELGYTAKPNWWSKMTSHIHMTDDQRLRALTSEVHGVTQPTERGLAEGVELGTMPRNRSRSRQQGDPFTDMRTGADGLRGATLGAGAGRKIGVTTATTGGTLTRETSMAPSTRTTGSDNTLTGVQPQTIRSMLDI
ncbi:hypothetical protein M501DRAFT_961244 [Patellaria atrata CBS 101060]|uniref:Uncharacterized protein n=1 Tax=Patellaria atrata CBS 101060 TaxID=1346257 RepID=A0A9P4VN25_9PEZI|nr:hypothetical protein M501DRAFT_961244 [Patellaria atrata CBS 101060]